MVAARPRRTTIDRGPHRVLDVVTDPWETRNLASSPEHRETIERLRAVLDAWIVESNDQGRIPEDAAIPAAWEERMSRTYDERIRERDARFGRKVKTPLP